MNSLDFLPQNNLFLQLKHKIKDRRNHYMFGLYGTNYIRGKYAINVIFPFFYQKIIWGICTGDFFMGSSLPNTNHV